MTPELKDIINRNMSEITVAEFIAILEKCPQDYTMNFLGDDEPAIYVDTENELVTVDNFSWMCEEYGMDPDAED